MRAPRELFGRGLVIAAFLLAGCQREERQFVHDPPAPPEGVNPYGNNAWSIGQGARMYRWFNCHGCHSLLGGGGMGPPLMDDHWIYGHEPAQVFTSIVDGRPNGMPAFRPRLTDQQAWQLVNYVLSLSGQVRIDARPARLDGMNPGASPTPREEKAKDARTENRR